MQVAVGEEVAQLHEVEERSGAHALDDRIGQSVPGVIPLMLGLVGEPVTQAPVHEPRLGGVGQELADPGGPRLGEAGLARARVLRGEALELADSLACVGPGLVPPRGIGGRGAVHKAYHPHSGLGSGTQIAVSTAHLIAETMGIKVESRQLSSIVGRGGTSGIGTYTHDLGGFIVDGGHSVEEKSGFLPSGASNAKPATLIARYDFPEDWNILLVEPNVQKHMEGDDEVNVFQTYCPIPKKEVEKVSHLILMNLIPFMLEKDIKNFGWAISELQKVGFNKLEHSLDSSFLPTMKSIEEAGAYGVGISSFGPTLYTFFDDDNKDIVDAAAEIVGDKSRILVTKAQNHGFTIEK